MIIFGTRGVKFTITEGNFHCPQCNTNKPFRHRKVRRFFTLYFIPVIPLDSLGEYVECRQCKGTFITRVLDGNSTTKNESLIIYENAIKHSMIKIMLADGIIDDNEKQQVFKIINKFCRTQITMSQLNEHIKVVQADRDDISIFLKKIGPQLNNDGKEALIKAAISVAAADGHIDKSEIELIEKMGSYIEMSPLHLKGVLASINDIVSEQKEQISKERVDKEDHSRFMPK